MFAGGGGGEGRGGREGMGREPLDDYICLLPSRSLWFNK